MTRVSIGNGRWFNQDTATYTKGDTYFDGSNLIDINTGSQWERQYLWRTAGGTWLINQYSQWQGVQETYEEVTEEEAALWLVTNHKKIPEELESYLHNGEV
jgi:hypothetical protein